MQELSDTKKISPKVYRALFLVGALLIVAWLGLKAWRLAQLAQSLQSYQAQAQALADEGLTNVDAGKAQELVMGLRRDVTTLRREVDPFLPLMPLFTWVPKVGPLFEAGEPLLEMADSGSAAAAYLARSLGAALPLLQSETGGSDLLPQLLAIVETARPDLLQANAALERFAAARAEIDNEEELPWRVRTLLDMVDAKMYLARDMEVLAALPELMGGEEPRNYLIVAQNEDEIRATGGFISGAGLLTVDEGKIVALSFEDANTVDDWRNKPYDFPPEPLYELMGLELFLFRDANFWPDFPTSAERIMQLYKYGMDSPDLDGVIAVDQQFVAMLVAVTGPLEIGSLETTVNHRNVIANMRDAWAIEEGESPGEWVMRRKDFMGPFANALQTKLYSNFGEVDPLFLAQTMHDAFSQKHVQVYVRDPRVAAVLDELDWDGRLETPDQGDMLMVVDTEVGYSKANALMEKSLTYEVSLNDDGSGTANLTLGYEHTGSARNQECTQIVRYTEVRSYDELVQRCFWNYLRLYVPPGSRLQDGTDHQVASDAFAFSEGWRGSAQTQEMGENYTVFSNFLIVPVGQAVTSSYRYTLPRVVSGNEQKHYRLQILKQAGQKAIDLEVRVTLPPGSVLVEATPAFETDGQSLLFKGELAQDMTLSLTYRPQ